ncbi:MAG: penicillin-binding protein activator [Aequoribacter sp.]|uniref:penicillin-binding protein activator n=1 Tax=Aequoribacter sp. TaxID=2847771 RepID=UPI003C363A31
MKHNALLTSLTLIGLSALLASCGQTPSKPSVKPQEQIVAPRQEEAEVLPPPSEPELVAMREALIQAELALASGQPYRALSLVQSIQYHALNNEEQLRGTFLQAQLDSQFGSYTQALERYQSLSGKDLKILGVTSTDIDQSIYRLAVLHQDHANIVRYGVNLLLDTSQNETQVNRLMAIAQALSYLDTKQLAAINRLLGKQQQTLLRSVVNANALKRRDFGAGLCEAWNSASIPGNTLETLCTADSNIPANNKLLVALPLSGRLQVAGEAILDGIIFSHLSKQSTSELHVVDTHANDDQAIFQQLQTGQYTGMIGPLEKNRVQAWQSLSALTDARIVSLNTPEQSDSKIDAQHFYQFALSPEAEATYLANTVFASGARRVLIIRPQTDWGARTLLALRNQWDALGGTEIATATYRGQEDYESSLRVALGVADSAARRRTLGRLSGLSMHLQARRREDIDAVIMLASTPEEARSIVPLLAFHFAEDLPVYTVSAANDLPHKIDHKDLDKVVTVDIASLPPIPNETPASAALARLTALGIDAYDLSQLPDPESPLRSLYRGETGLLWIDEQGFVQRQWKVLQYDRDERKAL